MEIHALQQIVHKTRDARRKQTLPKYAPAERDTREGGRCGVVYRGPRVGVVDPRGIRRVTGRQDKPEQPISRDD